MSYTCPDCEDGVLVAKVREIPIKDDEAAEIVDGHVRISSVRCNNGCSPETEEEEETKKPKRKKKAPAVAGELCQKCKGEPREAGHKGWHTKPKADEE